MRFVRAGRWGLICLAVAIPATSAQAASTKVLDVGTPPSLAKKLQKYSTDVNQFFPRNIQIAVGGKVKFVPLGFHNVNFPKPGSDPDALAVPGAAISGAKDAAGNPFWFNGQPSFSFNPVVLNDAWGKKATFSAADGFQSGLPLSDKPKPITLKFKKAGTFTFYCGVHPGMVGKVKVVKKGRKVQSSKADRAAVKKQSDAALKAAKAFDPSTGGAPNTVSVGLSNGKNVEYFDFAPDNLTVAHGTTVTFKMPDDTSELHTASTGPGDPGNDPTSYLGKLSASIESPSWDPIAVYPSDVPGSPASLTPTTHGNGFWNSGFMDVNAGSPAPNQATVTFAQAGTYTFYCLIHPFMKGTVTVT